MKRFKTLKRTLMLMLCIALVLGCFAACDSKGEKGDGNEAQNRGSVCKLPGKTAYINCSLCSGRGKVTILPARLHNT